MAEDHIAWMAIALDEKDIIIHSLQEANGLMAQAASEDGSRIASLTEAVRVLTEALEEARDTLLDDAWGTETDSSIRAIAALTTAKELTK